MPSSNKTLHLELNKWLGSDKPKKDDFNADNQKLDTACRQLSEQLGQLAENQQNGHQSNAQAVAALGNGVTAHIENASVHVTAAEKALWNTPASGGFTIGTYVGDGNVTKTITLGFRPQLGLVFPASQPPTRATFVSGQIHIYQGFMSASGATEGVELTSDGFRVGNTTNAMDGYAVKLNTTSQAYVYAVWK